MSLYCNTILELQTFKKQLIHKTDACCGRKTDRENVVFPLPHFCRLPRIKS